MMSELAAIRELKKIKCLEFIWGVCGLDVSPAREGMCVWRLELASDWTLAEVVERGLHCRARPTRAE